MTKLEEPGIEKHPIIGRQAVPWVVEFGLAPASHFLLRNVVIDSKDPSSDGAWIVPHTLDDLGAAQPFQPGRQFDGHLF